MKTHLAVLCLFFLNCKADSKQNSTAELLFTAPADWVGEQPINSMRKAQFRMPGDKPENDAELAVFYFPGAGGSVDANLNRWYGQFKQPDGSDTRQKVSTSKFTVNELAVTVVSVQGNYLKPRVSGQMGGPVDETPGYAMLAAIIETSGGPWFFKAVGPETTIQRHRNAFDVFVRSIKPKQ